MSKLFHIFLIIVFSISTLGAAVLQFKQMRVIFDGEITDIAAADLNKDGFDDIVIIDHDNKKVQVFMGDSNFKFSKQYVKAFENLGEYIIGIDNFMGKGKMDVAVDCTDNQTYFALFPGAGNGKLKKAKLIKAGSGSSSEISHASVSDFNSDGKPDISGLVDGSPDFLGAFINRGKGKFNSIQVQQKDYHSITSGDFDNDGNPDILVGDLYTDDVTFFKGQGDGVFVEGTKTNIGNLGSHLKNGFLNKDNRLDIVGSGNAAYDSGWSMLGKKNGKFVKKKTLPKWDWLGDGFCLIDFTGDKKLDIAEADLGGIILHGGRGTGAFKSLGRIGSNLYFGNNGFLSDSANITAGDFNGDGKIDFAGAHWDGYNGRKPVMTDLIIFQGNKKPVTFSISDLNVTTLSYTFGVITFKGSFNFQNSGGDLRYAEGAVVTDNAFLEFQVKLDFSWPLNDYIYTYWTTGTYLHMPGQTNGIINFDLNLPTTVFSTSSPELTLRNFSILDYNLVQSNELLETQETEGEGTTVFITHIQ
jgi:hypothetical protein